MQGYSVQMIGAAPSQGTHTLTPLTIPATSQAGQEQFGINLVNNSTPNIGADPVKLPDNESAMSYVSAGYSNANQFKYVSEDIIAENYSESGEVEYTISMILNISNATPGGKYTSDFSAVVVPFF
jgi:hypothetical protein